MNENFFAHLNINSLRNILDQTRDMIKGHNGVLMISESKLENSFPDGQFLIEGYSAPFRLDQNKHAGGIMLHVRNDIPTKLPSLGIGF